MAEGISEPHLYQNPGVAAPCVVLTGPLVEPDAERAVPLQQGISTSAPGDSGPWTSTLATSPDCTAQWVTADTEASMPSQRMTV